MNNSKFIKNVVSGFGGQFIIIILGIIVPRIFISSYGSDTNGLLSTIGQIFTYMALLEAGIGQAARNALYKPFQEKNTDEINYTASVARSYYRRFTIIYAVGVVILSLVLPYVMKTNVDKFTVFLIVFFEGISGVISFYYIQTPSIIISVDGKSYINNGITVVNKIVSYIVKIVLAKFGINVALLQFSYFIINVIKVFFYKIYFNKHYSWLKYIKVDKNIKLKDRNSYIITEIATTVFNSTDMIVLSMLLSTQLSSVYSVYNMIYSNVHLLLNSVYFSIVYILGRLYHSDLKKYSVAHDSFITIFLGLMTILMSVCYVLTIPFITLYTDGIKDVDYIYKQLPLLFSLVQILSWSRYVGGNLTCLAGYAKETSYVSLVEAILNITLSVILVNKFGIVGVLLATVLSLPLKVIWCFYISDKKVLKRSYLRSLSILGVNYLIFASVVVLSRFIKIEIANYISFALYGIVLTLIIGIIGMGLNLLVNRECWSVIKKYILKK